jgi:hypothetical protein
MFAKKLVGLISTLLLFSSVTFAADGQLVREGKTADAIDVTVLDMQGDSYLNGLDNIDATTKATIEDAIISLSNLVTIQSQTITLSGSLTVESASVLNQDLTTDANPTFNNLSLTGNLIIPDDGYIGSASDTDAMQIESDGDIVLTKNLYSSNGFLGLSAGSGQDYMSKLSTVYNYPYVDTYLDSIGGSSYEGKIHLRTSSGGGALTDQLVLWNDGHSVFSGPVYINSTAAGVYSQVSGANKAYVGYNNTSGYLQLYNFTSTEEFRLLDSGGAVFTGNVEASGLGGDATPILTLNGTANTTFSWASLALHPNLTTGNRVIHMFGQEKANANSGYIGFKYAGDNSASNALTFGLHSHDDLVLFYANGNAWFSGDVSADSFTDRTPFYEGEALVEISKIKGVNGNIDHSTLPEFTQRNDGRDLGAMISVLTKAVQEQIIINNELSERIKIIEDTNKLRKADTYFE